jgi:threonine aldolase
MFMLEEYHSIAIYSMKTYTDRVAVLNYKKSGKVINSCYIIGKRGVFAMIDLRSDTVTKPTEAMRKAAYEAEVGDDVYGEDSAVNELEETVADLLGKEAALFVPSGTQGNQIAILSHCSPGNEIILQEDSHIFLYEGAAASIFAGVQTRTMKGERGAICPEDLASAIRQDDIHFPETGLICLENTHNKAGGAVIPIENMMVIAQIAREHHIPIHLDGARLFNAAAASGISVAKYAQLTDTVQICLSKGLGAPAGSVIAGSKVFIDKARKWRKRLGGGMRQAGILAAPGLVALRDNADRLAEDHDNAKLLADGLAEIDGIEIINRVETNIVLADVQATGMTADAYVQLLKEQQVLANSFGPYIVRFVTHYDVGKGAIKKALSIAASLTKQPN